MTRFVNSQAVLRRGDGPFRPFGGAGTLRDLLFANSEPGFTFEPWDITTMYVDRAGTTPVTDAGQSVGLRLSKDQGLRVGPEILANGDFSGGTTGWSGSGAGGWVISGGVATHTAGTYGTLQTTATDATTVGKSYLLTFDFAGTGVLNIYSRNALIASVSGTGSKRFIFKAAATSGATLNFEDQAFNGTIDNISVKELAGNHEVAVSDAKRGVYGWMPKTGRRNLLTYTEQFDNAVWTKISSTVSANADTDPIGQPTADQTTFTAGVSARVVQGFAVSGSLTYTLSFYVKGTAGQTLSPYAESSGGTYSYSQPSTVTLTGAWQRVEWQHNTAAGNTTVFLNIQSSASNTAKVVSVWGAQAELGSTATAYQRVTSQYDITEAGVPTCYYVQADGVDDAYVTPTITPNTDKMQVFAGVRKLSDAAPWAIVGSSSDINTNNGAFEVANYNGAGGVLNFYCFRSKGTVDSGVVFASGYVAPITNVITGLGDISGDTATLRINGTQVAQSTSDQGTGNYLAYPAYIYGRGGTSLPFNGLDFGHAVRFGPNLDAATIARVESLIARNTPEVTL